MAPGLGGSGSFGSRRRLDIPARSRQPLQKDSPLMARLRQQTPETVSRLDRSGFRQSPKPKELPPGFIYSKAAAVGDVISCAGDEDDVIIGEVVRHRSSDGVVVCLDVVTGETFGVAPNTIVEVGA